MIINKRSSSWTLAAFCMVGLFIPLLTHAQAVQGYVDLHSHLVAEESFGGGWFWGSINGPMEWAVRRCDGNFLTHSHAATRFPIVSELIGDSHAGSDTGWHLGTRRGYDRRKCKKFFGVKIPGTCPKKHFEGWPASNAIAHQQMWWGWLKQAHEGGLQIMMVSLAESNFLCENTALASRRFGCDEMTSIKHQAVFARNFANTNSSWVGIAETPAQARSLIAQGKLALVLAVEVTKLFPTGDFIAQLDELRALGVRSVQVTHHADNRFGGAAPIPELIKTAGIVTTLRSIIGIQPYDITDIDLIACRNSANVAGTCDGSIYLNEKGLSNEGITLVNAMMDRGMLLDVSHLSRKSFIATYNLAKAHGNYPIIYSHTHMWDTISPTAHKNEKFLRNDEIHMITDTGGMIGLRTGSEDTIQYGNAVPLICQGSSRSFAQSLMYAVDKGLSVGFGADLNGFIGQMRSPYLGGISGVICSEYPPPNTALNEFQGKGLAHVGLLPQLIADLSRVGTPQYYLSQFNQSAEKFLLIWERSISLAMTSPGNNLALNAIASASSTYCMGSGEHCYSPSRVNDGDKSIALGGYHSWANATYPNPPQWVQLTWNNSVTFTRIDLFSTDGYPIRDFVVQYRTGTFPNYSWITLPASPTFPTANMNTYLKYTFSPITSSAIRVLCKSGPLIQSGYCRVNELEVY